MQDHDVTKVIIGCAYDVHNALGFGFLESVYQRALLFELAQHHIKAEQKRAISVFYKSHEVGKF